MGQPGEQGVNSSLRRWKRGHLVTAFARNPSALGVAHPNLTVVKGDVLDYPSIAGAVRGQDAVLSALGHKRFFYPTRILSEGTRNLVRAMETQGVKRLVCETSLGIGGSAGRLGFLYNFFTIPLILPFYFWDKARQEQLIAASHLDWVIVRPGALTNGAKRSTYRHGRSLGNFLWTVRISRANVAEFMLNQLTENTYLKGAATVCW